jgi:hypothetical protein
MYAFSSVVSAEGKVRACGRLADVLARVRSSIREAP